MIPSPFSLRNLTLSPIFIFIRLNNKYIWLISNKDTIFFRLSVYRSLFSARIGCPLQSTHLYFSNWMVSDEVFINSIGLLRITYLLIAILDFYLIILLRDKQFFQFKYCINWVCFHFSYGDLDCFAKPNSNKQMNRFSGSRVGHSTRLLVNLIKADIQQAIK